MIKIEHLNKYFNRRRQNEIHVINDTSLTFPEKGLVALTGPSGCGKTTLLNVIGGLDKFDSGLIHFDGATIRSYKPKDWDRIRNRSVGYIFQNYYLVEDKTVYENVEIALNLAGLYKPEEVEERVGYVLQSVGMYNHRHRNVLALSGGQQQRVAIARAIAKNPDVILADEPTGNLDANNTFEIMGIIKKISESRLVILVTHERDLVDFYADRVIELVDGKVVKDYENAGNRTLDRVDDRNIYLQDLELEAASGPVDVRYYHDRPGLVPTVRLVRVNDTLYVKAEGDAKIKYLGDDSEIRLLDAHYRKPETEDIATHRFDLNQFGTIAPDPKRKSFIRLKDTLRDGFRKFLNSRKLLGRFFLVVCFVVAALLSFNLARLSALLQDQAFLTGGRNFVQVEVTTDQDYAELRGLIDTTALDSFIAEYFQEYYLSNYPGFIFESYYQGSGNQAITETLGGGTTKAPIAVTVSQAGSPRILLGRLPEDNTEVAIDAWVADSLLASPAFQALGITEYEDLIGILSQSGSGLLKIEVVGIVQTRSPILIVSEDNKYFYQISTNSQYFPQGSLAGHYTVVSGRDIQGEGEILVSPDLGYPIGQTFAVAGEMCEVVGFYESEINFGAIIANADYDRMNVQTFLDGASQGWNWEDIFVRYASADPKTAVAQLRAAGYNAFLTYDYERTQNLNQVFQQMIFVVVGLVAVLVYVIFMMRSSVLSRVREVGIYRSIGATKPDIFKIFLSEIFAFSCLGSVTGYVVMSALILYVQSKLTSGFSGIGGMATIFYFPIQNFLLGLIGLLGVNILFGMMPIFQLLRRTPAEINTKYDI